MNKKSDFLKMIRWEKPESLCYGFGPLAMIREPGAKSFDAEGRDLWGVKWGTGLNYTTGRLCVVPGHDVIGDIDSWEEQLHVPDIYGPAFDYAKAAAEAAAIDREKNLVCLASSNGIFERTHYLLGFDNCLMQLLLEPEQVGEIMDRIADFKIELIREIYRHTHFDAIFYHDDWGAKTELLFSPEIWRTVIKPRHRRVVEAVKALGDVIFIHHSDTFLEPLLPDMVEMGIDVWQGCIPQNDLLRLQQENRGRIGFMGGIDIAAIDHPGCPEETIRAEVRRAVETYVPGGGFIPGVPSGGALYPEVQRIVMDELEKSCRELKL